MTTLTPWLIRPPRPNSQLRLFCFSYAGGSAVDFLAWRAKLAPRIDVCPLQLPGRGARLREAPLLSPAEVVDAALAAVREHMDVPFVCFGHSLGALLAFELARHCRSFGLPMPIRLIVSGCGAPRYLRSTQRPNPLHLLNDNELIAALRRYNGTPRQVLDNRELMELVLPVIRADFQLVSNYVYRPLVPLDVPLTVLAGHGDGHVAAEHVDAWRMETTADCDVRWFDGDHFFIKQQADKVAAFVESILHGSRATAVA